MVKSNQFKGEITVSSRIVDYLSSGLYESPAACLKELINNSYDADATLVEVFVKPDANRIIISDNGHGMDRDEFERHFKRISESHKRDGSDVTKLGRKKIGKIGIGFIAANEICDEMEIESTKRGSSELLRVTVYFAKMRQDIEDRRRGPDDIAKADYIGTVDVTDITEQYTHVFLKSVRGEARNILAGAKRPRPGSRVRSRSLYGLSPASVRRILLDPSLSSWSDFDDYSQTLLRVGLNVPVRYHDQWLPPAVLSSVEDLSDEIAALRFLLKYDASEVRKPIVLFPRGPHLQSRSCFVRRFEHSGRDVSASGYFYVQHGTIKPEELQGVLIRIRQAAVGRYDSTFLAFPASEGSLIQRWISAEIWADDRLEDAMNIDRSTLRIAHPAYVELQQALHDELREVIKDARQRLYEAGSKQRKKDRTTKTVAALQKIVRDQILPIDGPLASDLTATLHSAKDKKDKAMLARRLSIAELFQIVVSVARETLPAKQFSTFMRRLTERLNQ